jgi:RNA processing factor Prp31
MAKVIEFYIRDLFPKKVKWLPRDQRGKVIEFLKEKSALAAKADQIRERDEAGLTAVSWPGCF